MKTHEVATMLVDEGQHFLDAATIGCPVDYETLGALNGTSDRLGYATSGVLRMICCQETNELALLPCEC